MEALSIYDATTAKREVPVDQKAWKYIRDICNVNEGDLDKLAIIDGNRKYTYKRMFREWERYASVFTALNMTEEQNARVGVLGSTCAEVIFAFYGLNMVGAQCSIVASWKAFNFSQIEETIRQEKLTDFIVTDDIAQPDLIGELMNRRKELGLRNVIVLHVFMGGATAMPIMTATQEIKSAAIKALYWPICMDTLLMRFGNRKVKHAEKTDVNALIMHTTGTTSGTGKPVPMSDNALNSVIMSFLNIKNLSLPFDNLVTATLLDLSNSYGIINQVHLPFAMGATLVTIPLGFLNPWFHKAISSYGISFLFSASYMFDRWMKMPEDTDFDFTSLKFVALGGTAVSAAEKRSYNDFIELYGGKDVVILNGYGLSELGGACALSSPDLDDETIGYPLPGMVIRLYDENTETFFDPGDKGGEGVLYLSGPTMAGWQLDGNEVIKVDMIEGKPYVCTNDLVRMDPDGRITYLGRANRFFMRDEGRKYESGRVETEFNRLADINACAIVPVYYKIEHDTIPMLVVKTLDGSGDPKEVIVKALREVFIEEKTLVEDNIPARVLLAKSLPRNTNGKVDLHKINQGKVEGDMYTVMEDRDEEGQLTDFSLLPFEEDSTSDVVEMVIGGIAAEAKESGSNSVLVKGLEKFSSDPNATGALTLDVEKLSDPKSALSSISSLLSLPSADSMPFMPPMLPMPFMPMQGGDGKEQLEDLKSKVESFFGQQRDLQKASVKASKEFWGSFFG